MSDLADQVLEKVRSWIEDARHQGYSLADGASELLYDLEIMIQKDRIKKEKENES